MDFASYLVRQHFLTKDEFLKVIWTAMKAAHGATDRDGYLEPSLRELNPDQFDNIRPYPFGDVLKNSKDVLVSVLKRSESGQFEDLVDKWQQWHVDFLQPISDFCLSPRSPRPFGKRLYDNAVEKRLCGAWIAENLVRDTDHVIIPEGTSTFWVGIAVLARRRNLRIITSNGALIRELYENPKLRERAKSVSVIGGGMDVEVGGTGRGFVGDTTKAAFERAINSEPGATVVVSSVNGLLPEVGPFAPCPTTGFTRRKLLSDALPNVRTVALVADSSKMRLQHIKEYGDPIFPDKDEWNKLAREHYDRLAIVVAPPLEIRDDTALMSIPPRNRTIHGKGYSSPVADYLSVASRLDDLCCSPNGSDSHFHEAIAQPKRVPVLAGQ